MLLTLDACSETVQCAWEAVRSLCTLNHASRQFCRRLCLRNVEAKALPGSLLTAVAIIDRKREEQKNRLPFTRLVQVHIVFIDPNNLVVQPGRFYSYFIFRVFLIGKEKISCIYYFHDCITFQHINHP